MAENDAGMSRVVCVNKGRTETVRELSHSTLAEEGIQRWTLSAGQLIDIVKWNLLRHIPVKMRGGRR